MVMMLYLATALLLAIAFCSSDPLDGTVVHKLVDTTADDVIVLKLFQNLQDLNLNATTIASDLPNFFTVSENYTRLQDALATFEWIKEASEIITARIPEIYSEIAIMT